MKKLLKFAFSTSFSVFAISILASASSAQNANFSIEGNNLGGISMGPNGPAAYLNSGGGIQSNSDGSSWDVSPTIGVVNFENRAGASSSATSIGNAFGPNDSNAYFVQGDTGNETNNSVRTGQGPSGMGGRLRSPESKTTKQNLSILQPTSVTQLAPGSVNMSPIPSGSQSYGFANSPLQSPFFGVRNSTDAPVFAGELPNVSTGSVDINVVSK